MSSDPQAASDKAIKEAPDARAALHFSFPIQQRIFRNRRLLSGSVDFSLKCACRNHVHVVCSIQILMAQKCRFYAILEKTKITSNSKVKIKTTFVKHLST